LSKADNISINKDPSTNTDIPSSKNNKKGIKSKTTQVDHHYTHDNIILKRNATDKKQLIARVCFIDKMLQTIKGQIELKLQKAQQVSYSHSSFSFLA